MKAAFCRGIVSFIAGPPQRDHERSEKSQLDHKTNDAAFAAFFFADDMKALPVLSNGSSKEKLKQLCCDIIRLV
jgi:hypothetical protein